MQGLNYATNWQAHYIIEVSLNRLNSYHTNPLLNGISPCFVEGLVSGNILFNLCVGKGMKSNFCAICKSNLTFCMHQYHPGNYPMRFTGKVG